MTHPDAGPASTPGPTARCPVDHGVPAAGPVAAADTAAGAPAGPVPAGGTGARDAGGHPGTDLGAGIDPKGARLPGPGPLTSPVWPARGLRMLRDPAEYFLGQYARHGELSTWEPRRPKHVFALGPAGVRAVFSQPDVFVADAFRAVRMPTDSSFHRLSNGLLRLNGETHRSHRRLIQPTFTARRVTVYGDTVTELVERRIATWPAGGTVAMDEQLGLLILLIAMRTVLDLDEPAEVERLQLLIGELVAVAAAPTTLLLPYDLPGSTFRRALRVSERIEAVLRGLIALRRERATDGTDALSSMLRATDEDGSVLSEDELVSELYTVFCHDSSTATLQWALLLLDQHPDVLADLHDELSGELGGAAPDAAQLDRLPLLDAVLKETLRLLPPAPMLLRYTARETELGRYRLPEGATVFLSPYVTHRLPETFDEPTRFRPERWATARPSPYEYLPFGAGAHNCVGRHFALLEMKIILAVLLQRVRPALEPGTRVDRAMRVSMVPGAGLPMRLLPPGARRPPAALRGSIRRSVQLP